MVSQNIVGVEFMVCARLSKLRSYCLPFDFLIGTVSVWIRMGWHEEISSSLALHDSILLLAMGHCMGGSLRMSENEVN